MFMQLEGRYAVEVDEMFPESMLPQGVFFHLLRRAFIHSGRLSLDHKRLGRTKRSDRFRQGRAHIDIGEKALAPIGVGGEGIGATWHMGATVIKYGGIYGQ
jgi:hypothetical protein